MVASAAPSDQVRLAESYFLWLAGAIALFAFAGFSLTYWAPLASGRLEAAPILHLHGLLATSWTLFFVIQAWFATHGPIASHRRLGLLGIALATAMLFVGFWVAMHALQTGIGRGYEDAARRFAIVPVSGIIFFAVIVALAVANVRRPETHMRLMLLASISILQAAAGRIVRISTGVPLNSQGGPPAPVEITYLPASIVDLFLVAAIVLDWRARGKIHPVYLIGGAALVAMQFSRGALSETPLWNGFLDWLMRFAA